jgi:hypothetical protein
MNVIAELTSKELKEGRVLAHTDDQANRELVGSTSAALKNANEQGQPFVLAWRPDAKHPHWAEHDAGCGCGPID